MIGARPPRVVVAALGTEFRRDDGAGPAVVARLGGSLHGAEVLGALGDPVDLIGRWDGAEVAVVIDAVRSAESDVVMLELQPTAAAGPAREPLPSTHALGLVQVLRLSLALGRAPARVVLVGVPGRDFGHGPGLSAEAARAVAPAARKVEEVVRSAISSAASPRT
jgi:hydrogenase maturation protease